MCGHSSHVIPVTETIPYLSHAQSWNFMSLRDMFGYKPNPSISQYGFQCFILPMIKKYSLPLDLKQHKAIMSG